MASYYQECQDHVDEIEKAYDALLDALESYETYLTQAAGDDEELKIALGMQAKGARRMKERLEKDVLDDLIRFSDRVIRIKHWEDGVFL